MSEWKRVQISDVSDFFIGGTPSRSNPKFWAEKPSGHPWIAISDLKQKYISDTEEHITGSGVIFSNVKEIPPESVVMSFKLSIGKAAITKQLMYCNEAIVFFQPNEELSSRWLYHAIPKAANAVIVDTAVKGSTLNKKKIADIELFLPGIEEQKTIATILDTLDTQIRQTEAIIAKLQQVKQGLLHDLLTRGIDESGQLRPPYEQAPELYKDSPLGWIPKEWALVALNDVAEVDRGKFTHRPRNDSRFYGGRHPFIQTGDVAASGGDVLTSFSQSLSDLGTGVSKEFPEGAIAVTIAANIADTCILGRPMYFPDSIVAVVVGSGVSIRYIELVIRAAKRTLDAKAPQSAQKNINLQDLRPLLVPLPNQEEQARISERYESFMNRLNHEIDSAKKLKKQKAGLMDDLLTGRVRVTELIEQQQQAS